eukprot:scaffold121_cov412-Prasinococcus_capsulatus_cf.AAC.16
MRTVAAPFFAWSQSAYTTGCAPVGIRALLHVRQVFRQGRYGGDAYDVDNLLLVLLQVFLQIIEHCGRCSRSRHILTAPRSRYTGQAGSSDRKPQLRKPEGGHLLG